MKTKATKLLATLLAICIAITALPTNICAATAKINKKSATIYVGKTVQLKVTGTTKKSHGQQVTKK